MSGDWLEIFIVPLFQNNIFSAKASYLIVKSLPSGQILHLAVKPKSRQSK